MDNFEPIDVKFLLNSDEVSKKSATIKSEITGIAQNAENHAAKANNSINKVFVNTEKKLQEQQNQLTTTKRKWNGLGNSINQLSREMPAFAVSAQTGILALSNNIPMLADEISRLRVENEALKASGQKTVPVWKQLIKSTFSFNTLLSIGVTLLTLYGKEVGIFIKALFKGKDVANAAKKSIDSLNNAFKSTDYQKAVEGLITVQSYLNSAKKGYLDKTDAVNKYNEVLGDTLGKVNSIAAAEKNLNTKAGAYVEAMLYKTAATLSLKEAAEKLVENAKKQFENQAKVDQAKENNTFDDGKTDEEILNETDPSKLNRNQRRKLSGLRNVVRKQKELTQEAAKEQKAAVDLATSLNDKAAELAKKLNIDLFGTKGKGVKSTVNDYEKLLQKITDLDKEYARKSLTSNEAEIQALKDKFSKMRKLVNDFNNDPKNKGEKIDGKQINTIEQRALNDLTYRHETEDLKEELLQKKQLFIDFEEFKKQFGVEKAKENFAEQIGEFEDYLQYVNSKIAENQTTINAVKTGVATGGEKERTGVLITEKDNAVNEQKVQFDKMLVQLRSFEIKRQQLIANYQEKRKKLIEKGFVNEAIELDQQHQQNLENLDAIYAKGTPQYKALMDGVSDLSTKAARTVIENARRMVQSLIDAGRLTENSAKEINKKIDNLENQISNNSSSVFGDIGSDAKEIAGAFAQLSEAVRDFDEDAANSLETMSDLANITGDLANAAAAVHSGDAVGAIVGLSGAISGILSIGAKVRESERLAREEIREWQAEIFAAQLAYNSELRKRIIDETRLNDLYESRVVNIQEELEANKKNAAQVIKDQEEVFSKLLKQKTIVDKKTEKSGGFLGIGKKTKTVDIKKTVAELLGAGEYVEKKIARGFSIWSFKPEDVALTDELFDKLEKINGEKPLTGDAKTAYEQLVKLREEYGSIEEAQRQLQIELKNQVTGTTAQSIGDAIKTAALEGRDTFASVADDIEGFLRNAIIAGMNTKIIEPEIQKLQDKLYDFLGDGVITQDEKDSFQQMYANVSEAANQYLDLVNQTGEDLFEDSTSALQGGIARQITEETGSELTGLMRGLFDITKQHAELFKIDHEFHKKVFDVNLQILEANEATARNTAATVDQLEQAVQELKNIKNNTQQSQTARDRGV